MNKKPTGRPRTLKGDEKTVIIRMNANVFSMMETQRGELSKKVYLETLIEGDNDAK